MREEAAGCIVSGQWVNGALIAPGASCQLSETGGLKAMGLVSRTFDDFRFDPRQATLVYSGRLIRNTQAGQVAQCFQADLTLASQ